MLVGKCLGDRIYEILGRDGEFRVAAVHGVTRKRGMVAEVFHSRAAKFASLVRAVQPGNADAIAALESPRALAETFDYAYDLMPGNHRGFFRRQFALDNVKIRAANAAHFHAHEDFTLARPRVGRVGEFERIALDRRGRIEQTGLHRHPRFCVE